MVVTTGFCPVGAGRITYDRSGSGPAVVFLHGIGGNRSNWAEQLVSLGANYTCVAWDAMGYGDSSDPADGMRFEHFAEELKMLLDDLNVDRAHLVGLSMGGHIAQSFYSLHPERVATLTLAATSAGLGVLSKPAQQDFAARRLTPLENGLTPADTSAAVVEVLVGRKANAAIRERLRKSFEAVHKGAYMQTVHAILTTDFRPLLPRISVPTLVIVGEDDRVLPPEHSVFLARAIPGASLSLLEETGHLCNIEAPDSFAAILKDFLDRHSASATVLRAPGI